jgi:hypothetical protein
MVVRAFSPIAIARRLRIKGRCADVVGGAVLLGFVTMSAAQPAIRSCAAGETADTAVEAVLFGVTVESGTAKSVDVVGFGGNEVDTTISANSLARARTDFGVNRIHASGAATSFAGTDSIVTASGTLTGRIDMTAQDLTLRFPNGDPMALGLYFHADFGIASSTGGSAPIVNLTGEDFADALRLDATPLAATLHAAHWARAPTACRR